MSWASSFVQLVWNSCPTASPARDRYYISDIEGNHIRNHIEGYHIKNRGTPAASPIRCTASPASDKDIADYGDIDDHDGRDYLQRRIAHGDRPTTLVLPGHQWTLLVKPGLRRQVQCLSWPNVYGTLSFFSVCLTCLFLIRTHPKHVLYSSRPGLSISRTRVRLFLSSLASTGLSQRINVPEKSIS